VRDRRWRAAKPESLPDWIQQWDPGEGPWLVTEEALRALGYTEEQIAAVADLQE
jgi:hypothetical protein